ncbi:hypothetical protein K1719_025327 [Acacia pycnantha]|nr:hypothetical protein K1719_025327 [Acacia pycnantha]
MENERKRLLYPAKLAEQAERFDDMVEAMKGVAKLGAELTVEERNLVSIGIKDYRMRVEDEISNICYDILSLIDKYLLPSFTTGESTVFYSKMKGDYYRYLTEFKSGGHRKEAADESLRALGLALNFSVFYYEILSSSERACYLAQKALVEATAELDNLNEKSYKDSTLIMLLLRDNLTLWAPDLDDGDEPSKGDECKVRIKLVEVMLHYIAAVNGLLAKVELHLYQIFSVWINC